MLVKVLSYTEAFESKEKMSISTKKYKDHPDWLSCVIIEHFKKNEKYYPVKIFHTKPIITVIVYNGYDQQWKNDTRLLELLNNEEAI